MKLIVILLLLTACGSSSGSKETNKDTSMQKDGTTNDITKTIPGQENIRVKLNERFDIRLNAVMGTGNSWWLADSAFKSNLSLDTTFTEVDSSGKDGAPETQVFRFKGISVGGTSLTFYYSQPWKKEEKPSDTRAFNVTVE